jgi:hypothetical protein
MPKLEKVGISPSGRDFDDASVTLERCAPARSGLTQGITAAASHHLPRNKFIHLATARTCAYLTESAQRSPLKRATSALL